MHWRPLLCLTLLVLVLSAVRPSQCLTSAAAASPSRLLRTEVPVSWQPVAPAALGDYHSFILCLPQRNVEQLKARVAELSDPLHASYQQWLSRSELQALTSTPPAIVAAVLGWLSDAGISASQLVQHSDALEVNATVAAVNRAFRTSLHVFEQADGARTVRALHHIRLPAHVAPHLQLMLGLHTFPFPTRHSAQLLSAKLDSAQSPSPAPRSRAAARPSPTSASIAASRFYLQQVTHVYSLMTPRELAVLYGFPDLTQLNRSGSDIVTSVAVAEFDRAVTASFSSADIDAQGLLADVPFIQSLPSLYGSNAGLGTPEGQASYDIQQVTANNPSTDAWFWEESSTTWLYGLCLHLQTLASPPQVVSLSWTTSEPDADVGGDDGITGFVSYMERSDTELVKLAALGISVLAISGSQGASGSGNPYCVYNTTDYPDLLYVEWPAASAYVTAVGATGFSSFNYDTDESNTPFCGLTTATCPAGYTAALSSPWLLRCIISGVESAVTGITRSGGGWSRYTPQPSWQAAAVSAYLASTAVSFPPSSYYNASNRAVPDVAMYGFGIPVVVGSVIHVYGGVSTPLFAVLVSLLNAVSILAGGGTLGLLNPLLYFLAANVSGAVRDITTGDNAYTNECVVSSTCGGSEPCGCSACQGFYATTGWDAVTGLGAPVYSTMAAYIQGRVRPPPTPSSTAAAPPTAAPSISPSSTIPISSASASPPSSSSPSSSTSSSFPPSFFTAASSTASIATSSSASLSSVPPLSSSSSLPPSSSCSSSAPSSSSPSTSSAVSSFILSSSPLTSSAASSSSATMSSPSSFSSALPTSSTAGAPSSTASTAAASTSAGAGITSSAASPSSSSSSSFSTLDTITVIVVTVVVLPLVCVVAVLCFLLCRRKRYSPPPRDQAAVEFADNSSRHSASSRAARHLNQNWDRPLN